MSRWLFSARIDLGVFLGSAVASLVLLAVGAHLGILHQDTPEWAWVPAVLLVDVAHVYTTSFRVYFDRRELARRPQLYLWTPVLCWAIGVALYSESPAWFWRALAYMAVFHFVRQQKGWVALYRARMGQRDPVGGAVDTAAIYAATVYPLIYWHAHLPRQFWWFLPGDFAAAPALVADLAAPVYWGVLAVYVGYAVHRRDPNVGKHIVVATTAVCWYAGIVAFDSDYAFTVTNVIIHGVPYFALVYWYGRSRNLPAFRAGPWVFVAVAVAFAFAEELLWDRTVWHERAWLFGDGWRAAAWHTWLVPLLAVPQATHYVLDGFIWRRRDNPDFTLIPASAGPDDRARPAGA